MSMMSATDVSASTMAVRQAFEAIDAKLRPLVLSRVTTDLCPKKSVCWNWVLYGAVDETAEDPAAFYVAAMHTKKRGKESAAEGTDELKHREEDDDMVSSTPAPPTSQSLQIPYDVEVLRTSTSFEPVFNAAAAKAKVKRKASVVELPDIKTKAAAKAYHEYMLSQLLKNQGFKPGNDVMVRAHCDKSTSRFNHIEFLYNDRITITKGDDADLYAIHGYTNYRCDLAIEIGVTFDSFSEAHRRALARLALAPVEKPK